MSIERNDWICGKEDLFEISVHRFETMLKGCSLSARVESNFSISTVFQVFAAPYSRASNYIRSCDQTGVEISDARRTWKVKKRFDWTASRLMRVTRLNNDQPFTDSREYVRAI